MVRDGFLLAIGLFEPAAAGAVIAVMVVAIGSVHWGNGVLAMTNGVELPLLYIAGAVCLALTGPGAYSIDDVLGLTPWWTPQLTLFVLVAGFVGAFVNLGLRRKIPEGARS